MKRVVLVLLVAGIAWYLALPSRAVPMPPLAVGLTLPPRGAIHVHTRRSDGTGTPEAVAAAAERAGLNFIVLTDHGDGTLPPEPPVYRGRVLCIDAVEISTDGGHVLALGLSGAPYPLGGEPRDVLDDIERLGGFAIAAHPASAKPELRWSDWSLPIGGLEWLNADSEWRDESALALVRALFTYPARRHESLARLLDRPDDLMKQWDALSARRRTVAVAAADAHARIGMRNLGEPYDSRALLPIPSYEASFRTFSIAVPGVTLTGNAPADASAVLDSIRQGRVYSTVDALAGPAALSLGADGKTLRVAAQAPPGASIVLLRDGREQTASMAAVLEHDASKEPGVYRVEVRLPGAPGSPPVPWVVSNAMYVGRPDADEMPASPGRQPTEFETVYDDGAAADWVAATGARSVAAIDRLKAVDGGQIGFRFALGGALSESPYAALVVPAGPRIAKYERLVFTARASRPMRVSVQLQAPGGAEGQRWHRSVYLNPTPRVVTIAFDDMTPRGVTSSPRPVLGDVQSVLFVVDTVNAETGSNGQFVIDDVKYAGRLFHSRFVILIRDSEHH